MSSYIILSEKSWNKDLVKNLQQTIPSASFVLIDKKEDFTEAHLKTIKPEKIFIPHWSYIIPKNIYDNFECIVFHMTDLPYGRGGSPLQNLIARGHRNTKISALRVVKELDAGDIYLKKELSLFGTAEEIFLRANETIGEMIPEIIKEKLSPEEQKGTITHFKRRTPEMSTIEGIKDLGQLFDQIRMLDAEGYPKAYFENEEFRFEFSRASLKSNQSIIADVRITKK